MCSCTPKISWTTSTVGNGPPLSGIARYAGIDPSATGTLTSPASSPVVSVWMASANIGWTDSAKPVASEVMTNPRRLH
jgi:hypothetical protein